MTQWWAFSFDYGKRIGVVALREDRTQASMTISVTNWEAMDTRQQYMWLRVVIEFLEWKLERED